MERQSFMSQPDPSPSQAPLWLQPSPGSRHSSCAALLGAAPGDSQGCDSCSWALSAASSSTASPVPCCPGEGRWLPCSSQSPLLLQHFPLCNGTRVSCSAALGLFWPVCTASLFLEIRSCGCLNLHRRKNPLELSPPPQAVHGQRSDHLLLAVAWSCVLSSGTAQEERNTF